MILDPRDLDALPLYELLVTLVVPRPIALVSTVSREGVANLAPFSYFSLGGMEPPSLVVVPGNRADGRPKDTAVNARETGEFCVNLVDRAMAVGMNEASRGLPPDADEWPLTGFTPLDCETIAAKRIGESPAAFECATEQVVQVGSAYYVIGQIRRIHIADRLWAEGKLATDAIPLIARLGGPRYLDLSDLSSFELNRPS